MRSDLTKHLHPTIAQRVVANVEWPRDPGLRIIVGTTTVLVTLALAAMVLVTDPPTTLNTRS